MATVNSHDVTQIIGDCGRFQVVLSLAINCAYITAAWGVMFMTFGIYNPGFSCLDSEGSNSSSLSNISIMNDTDSSLRTLIANNNITNWSLHCKVSKGCKNLIYNPESSTIVTEWDLSCDSAWVPSTMISIQFCGVLMGAYFVGHIGDKFGRKAAICISLVFQVVSHLIASFSVSWQMYASILFFLGMGSGGILASTFHYPLEFLTAWWRGILASIPFWNIGCAVFALSVFLLKDWRNIHITGCIVSALSLLPLLWTPESVRWLAVKGKVDEAKQIIAKIASVNGRPCPETHLIDDIAKEEKNKMGDYKYTYLDLFRIKSIRGYSIKFGLIWIIMAMSYYSINFGIKSLSGNFYLNLFIFSVFDFPVMLSVAPAVTKLGRRKATILYFGAASASSLGIVICFFVASGSVRDLSILILALMCKTVILSSWYVVKVFSSELHPTVVRSLHYGYVNAVARLGAIISPYVISKNPDTLYVPFLVIGILTLFVCGCAWTLPETKNINLPDSANIEKVEANPLTNEMTDLPD